VSGDAGTGHLMPLAEAQFRHALSISQGDLSLFVRRPLTLALLLLALLALLLPCLPVLLARLRGKQPHAGRLVFGDGRSKKVSAPA
jgi:putative tricarboxylic transport membrane protein